MHATLTLTTALVTLLLPAATSAHYVFSHLIAAGNYTDHYAYVRENSNYYMPTKSVLGSDFRCNTGSLASAPSTSVYGPVAPGTELGFGLAYDATIEHPGPLSVYLSPAPSGTDVRAYAGDGDWVKIYELGATAFTADGIEWGVTGSANFTFTLPAATPAGQYLVRIEHLALHGAMEYGGAEWYFTCGQIEVAGGGSEERSWEGVGEEWKVRIPGVYTGYEPGVLFNMYYPTPTNYTAPGPAVWSGEGAGAEASASASAAVPTTESVSTSSAVASATVAGEAVAPSAVTTSAPISTPEDDDACTMEWITVYV
ncbi:hypothetical protein BO66DRAFT_283386 [Neofusicoccum parvum]|uniref:Uncharacterized protein n=1 Tax=Neofusicoccum parvum TaxID=310453 RepID=A0ACB5SCD2_9PEZI|nr:hypothetical protein BO66DRAFT_283386 [Neofusicoccum parvum]